MRAEHGWTQLVVYPLHIVTCLQTLTNIIWSISLSPPTLDQALDHWKSYYTWKERPEHWGNLASHRPPAECMGGMGRSVIFSESDQLEIPWDSRVLTMIHLIGQRKSKRCDKAKACEMSTKFQVSPRIKGRAQAAKMHWSFIFQAGRSEYTKLSPSQAASCVTSQTTRTCNQNHDKSTIWPEWLWMWMNIILLPLAFATFNHDYAIIILSSCIELFLDLTDAESLAQSFMFAIFDLHLNCVWMFLVSVIFNLKNHRIHWIDSTTFWKPELDPHFPSVNLKLTPGRHFLVCRSPTKRASQKAGRPRFGGTVPLPIPKSSELGDRADFFILSWHNHLSIVYWSAGWIVYHIAICRIINIFRQHSATNACRQKKWDKM